MFSMNMDKVQYERIPTTYIGIYYQYRYADMHTVGTYVYAEYKGRSRWSQQATIIMFILLPYEDWNESQQVNITKSPEMEWLLKCIPR